MLIEDVQELDEAQKERARVILEKIEEDPDVNQATLADRLDVAVGTVNWHIKRMVEKGYIKLKRAERKKLKYIITPEGLAFRAHLTVKYIENSMMLYRRTRSKVVEILAEVHAAGYESIRVTGEGDLAEVIHLTCLEQGVTIGDEADLPAIEIQGWKVYLNMDGRA
jgi:DNA-binding MarR family transcriptional regulator